ncbi:MAG: FAD-binding oxidoreductase [Hyphomicrobiaceae bacterium]
MSLPINTRPPSSDVIDALTDVVGAQYAIADPQDQKPYLSEWRDKYVGKTALVLRPQNTKQVSEILAIANAHQVGIVPQGGNTGLVGGQIPFETGEEIILSTSRMTRVREHDSNGRTLTVEAGVTLAKVQELADEIDCLFPLSLAAEGSCQIGGNLATNAGGVGVLAYGSTRQLVLGLEVVLADGRVWDGLRTLKKDNTGFDLRDLFVGSEGTLGIITAAALKLFPKPSEKATALVGVNTLEAASRLFHHVSEQSEDLLTAFEFFPHIALEFVTAHMPNARMPMTSVHPWYVLLETSRGRQDDAANQNIETALSGAMEKDLIVDAIIAQSQTHANDLWRLREGISEAQKPEGGSIKHDISVPISSIPEFVQRANTLIEKMCPGARPVPFGHFGDGNVHYNVSQPKDADTAAYLEKWNDISHTIHNLVASMGGSISAEHGIGRMKRDELIRFKAPVEIDIMRNLKTALDPKGILNPGKLL